MSARGQQQRVVRERAAIGYFDAAPQAIETHYGKTQTQDDVMVRIVSGVPEQQAIAVE
jgi:hypothetical protein